MSNITSIRRLLRLLIVNDLSNESANFVSAVQVVLITKSHFPIAVFEVIVRELIIISHFGDEISYEASHVQLGHKAVLRGVVVPNFIQTHCNHLVEVFGERLSVDASFK